MEHLLTRATYIETVNGLTNKLLNEAIEVAMLERQAIIELLLQTLASTPLAPADYWR